jgi:hypothetical protein
LVLENVFSELLGLVNFLVEEGENSTVFAVEILEKSEWDLRDLGRAMSLLLSHGLLEFFTMFTYLLNLLLYHTKLKASLILHEIVHSQFLH